MIYQFEKLEEKKLISGHLHMGGCNPAGECINVNSSYFVRKGKPWIPIMGEFHFPVITGRTGQENSAK